MSATATIFQEVARHWAPPRKLTVSQWADENRRLTLESSAQGGKWKTRPYQREPMDAFTDSSIHTIVLMVARQTLKTELINNCLGYIIDQDPGPVLLVHFRDTDCARWSKIRLAPMLRTTVCLRGKVADEKSRVSGNTLEYKSFPGGHLSIVASGSPGNLAALPIRYLFCDEIDKYPVSAGGAGDPISLAQGRQEEFWNRKTVLACTPTNAGSSRIEDAWLQSDQREYEIQCPDCGHFQIPDWDKSVQWDDSLPRHLKAASGRYICEACASKWDDSKRWAAIRAGRYRATSTTAFNGVAGFRVSGIARARKLSDLIEEFLTKNAGGPESLKTFINEQLAELWRERGSKSDPKRLYEKAAIEKLEIGIVPKGALFLTAYVDVQDDWLALEVKAWGPGWENWSVYYAEIRAQREVAGGRFVTCRANEPELWAKLDNLLTMEWPCEGGGFMPIWCTGIDSGYAGSNAGMRDAVYAYCAGKRQPDYWGKGQARVPYPRPGAGGKNTTGVVVPTKGGPSSEKAIAAITDTDAARRHANLRLITLGTIYLKDQVLNALRLEYPTDGKFPPGYCHYTPQDIRFFEELCNETRVVKPGGVEYRREGRNEPFDTAVGNLAMAELCGIRVMQAGDWRNLAKRREESAQIAEIVEAPAAVVNNPKHPGWFPPRREGSWFQR